MIAYLIPIAVLYVAGLVFLFALCRIAAQADRMQERIVRERKRSVADGVDWAALAQAGRERQAERRRQVVR